VPRQDEEEGIGSGRGKGGVDGYRSRTPLLLRPGQQALTGDAAYVVRKDGLATIKVFQGGGEKGSEWLRFKDWPALNQEGPTSFSLDLPLKNVGENSPDDICKTENMTNTRLGTYGK